ncbi:GPR endopeptidase [Tenuibacillus multivorans]|uniref:Germination protease n=1 Tax=Tenuibacillus multivorans TaxID=237069 RepID=A0A1G9ZGY9_9BACI|nr:GPR endopeptidase [Tenuibacillus multivorans]GEL78336.1 germination protease [Tenuibacillus multivorans]SDN19846.1 spore protease [Tenuibacillus multivorans]
MDRRKFMPRTDLALEAREMFVEQNPEKKHELDGIIIKEYEQDEFKLTRVEIDEKGSERVGKKPGNYVTVESQRLRKMEKEFGRKSATVLAQEFSRLIDEHQIPKDARCLIVGLGNGYVTPDALGPNTVNKVYVTSHLFKLQPEMLGEGDRSVSAFTPGVMGLTGMETSDIIFGVVQKTNPDFMVVIDALAARSIDRVNTTLQLSDTGINPGSGIGNDRKEVSQETLNIPVFSLGIPTVVDAVTITNDTIDYILKHFGREMEEKDRPSKALAPSGIDFGERRTYSEEDLPDEEARQTYLGIVGALKEDEKRQLIREVLRPTGHNLIVTPKEVDEVIEYMSSVVASGINQALHDSVNAENAKHYLK